MADDIEEFLKRVAEKRRGQQGGRTQPQQPKPQQQQPAQRPPLQRPVAPPPQQPRAPLPVSPPPVVMRQSSDNLSDPPAESSIHQISTDDVQKHAQQYMSRAEFDARSKQAGLHAKPLAHLESRVAQPRVAREPDTKSTMPREVDVFAAVQPVQEIASPLAAILQSREAFRSAFLLSLVLDKPAWKDE
jgi:hypothetical protein